MLNKKVQLQVNLIFSQVQESSLKATLQTPIQNGPKGTPNRGTNIRAQVYVCSSDKLVWCQNVLITACPKAWNIHCTS